MRKKIDITFIVPVLSAADVFNECIRSILAQRTEKSFEVIVVDNSPDERNHDALKTFEGALTLVRCLKLGAARARNAGAAHARGEFLAFIDSDVILPPNWIEILCKSFQEFPYDCVTSSIVPSPIGNRFLDRYRKARLSAVSLGTYSSAISRLVPFRPTINSAACVYRKSSFERINGFDETLARFEDIELSLRGFFHGFHFFVSTEVTAKVYYEGNIFSYLGRSFRDGYHVLSNDSLWRHLQAPPELKFSFLLFYWTNTICKVSGILVAKGIGKSRSFTPYVFQKRPENLLREIDVCGSIYSLSPYFRFCKLDDRTFFLGKSHCIELVDQESVDLLFSSKALLRLAQ